MLNLIMAVIECRVMWKQRVRNARMFIPPFRVLNVSISPRLPDKYLIKLSRMFHHIQLKGQNIIEKYYILLALRI